VYEWKEAFIEWYDGSSTYEYAQLGFVRWLAQGDQIDHVAVQNGLKTMRNWQEEITKSKHYNVDIILLATPSTTNSELYWNVMRS
jgi:hypothetical protein